MYEIQQESKPETHNIIRAEPDDISNDFSADIKQLIVAETLKLSYLDVHQLKCNHCDKYFADSKQLKRHDSKHRDEKRFRCDHCEKYFGRASSLRAHNLIHSGEKRHKCDECGRCFNKVSNLNTHKVTHTGEKRYKFFQCDSCYSRMSSLKRHILLHGEEKLYKCRQCEQCFTVLRSLDAHIVSHFEDEKKSIALTGDSGACSQLLNETMIFIKEENTSSDTEAVTVLNEIVVSPTTCKTE